MPTDNTPIERKETAIRLLLTLLFVVIVEGIIKAMLAVIILFALAYVLITRRPPGERVRRFANRTLSYLNRITRFLTDNESEPPFPFAAFPAEVDPPARLHQSSDGGLDR